MQLTREQMINPVDAVFLKVTFLVLEKLLLASSVAPPSSAVHLMPNPAPMPSCRVPEMKKLISYLTYRI